MYFQMFEQMKKQLTQMDKWLESAAGYADAKKFDSAIYANLRLAPDQLAFGRQIQIACDTAKLGSSRLTGKPAPSHDDNETTLEQFRARIQSTLEYLNTHTAKDFEGASERKITQPRWKDQYMTGENYFFEHVVPNFFFHTSHVYAILRHNGMDIGKKDYLGALSMKNA